MSNSEEGFEFLKNHLRSQLGSDVCELIDGAANSCGGVLYLSFSRSDPPHEYGEKLGLAKWLLVEHTGPGKVFEKSKLVKHDEQKVRYRVFTISRLGRTLANIKPNDIPTPEELGIETA